MRVRSPVWEDPWRRTWQPTPAFLPGEPGGQRSLAGCGRSGHTELDSPEATRHACMELQQLSKES